MIAAKVAKGIATTIIRVCRTEPRNNKTAIAASAAPIKPEVATLEIELRINRDSSKVGVRTAPSGMTPDFRNCSIRFLTLSTTSIVLASGCF